ncbi:MAG: AMP-binding protein [Saprospiraceae bacterium]
MAYYKNEEATNQVLDKEGWFSTGDLGCWSERKFLEIRDRKKDIFKLSDGKYIAPASWKDCSKKSI